MASQLARVGQRGLIGAGLSVGLRLAAGSGRSPVGRNAASASTPTSISSYRLAPAVLAMITGFRNVTCAAMLTVSGCVLPVVAERAMPSAEAQDTPQTRQAVPGEAADSVADSLDRRTADAGSLRGTADGAGERDASPQADEATSHAAGANALSGAAGTPSDAIAAAGASGFAGSSDAPRPYGTCARSKATACFTERQLIRCDGQRWSAPETCENGGECHSERASDLAAFCRLKVLECEGLENGTRACSARGKILYACGADGFGEVVTACMEPLPSCVGGRCTCRHDVCDDRCVVLADDPWHCGFCGNECRPGNVCRDGVCVPRY